MGPLTIEFMHNSRNHHYTIVALTKFKRLQSPAVVFKALNHYNHHHHHNHNILINEYVVTTQKSEIESR